MPVRGHKVISIICSSFKYLYLYYVKSIRPFKISYDSVRSICMAIILLIGNVDILSFILLRDIFSIDSSVWLALILAIISVSTFVTAVILYASVRILSYDAMRLFCMVIIL